MSETERRASGDGAGHGPAHWHYLGHIGPAIATDEERDRALGELPPHEFYAWYWVKTGGCVADAAWNAIGLGDLAPILLPSVALQALHPLRREAERAQLPDPHVAKPNGALYNHLLRWRALEWRLDTAADLLERAGWRLNPDTRAVEALPTPGSPGNRPMRLVTRCIEQSYAAVGSNGEFAPAEDRELIAELLAPYFLPEFLDAGPRGNIKAAIDNYRAKRRR